MSLARLALRIAAVEALRPAAAITSDGPWPTLARSLVFDTRIGALADLGPGENHPVICVYTEDDEGKAGQARGGPPFFDTVTLEFELSVMVRMQTDADPAAFDVGYPETDAEMEASLDLLEAQVKFVMIYGPTGEIWRRISKRRVHEPHSVRHASGEEGVKLAKRTVKWRVEIQDDCWDPAPTVRPTGNDVLPFPLSFIVTQLASNSYGAKIIAGLTREPTMPVMPVAAPLDTVTLNESIADPDGTAPAAPNILAEVDNLES